MTKWQTDKAGLQERAGGLALIVSLTIFAITKTVVCEDDDRKTDPECEQHQPTGWDTGLNKG